MNAIILDNIPFSLNFVEVMKKVRLRAGSEMAAELRRLVDQAQALGRPRALYKTAYIDERGDDYAVIDGVRFSSRVLSVNLAPVHRVFPYLASCGPELEEWGNGIGDMLAGFWAETIKEVALRAAMSALVDHLDTTYRLGQTSAMAPGSLEDWPIQQQRPLFTLLGDTEAAIGVRLTDSMLMIPTKTVSGVRFPTEARFESCQLCPRENCPNRRAPYQTTLYDEKYSAGTQ